MHLYKKDLLVLCYIIQQEPGLMCLATFFVILVCARGYLKRGTSAETMPPSLWPVAKSGRHSLDSPFNDECRMAHFRWCRHWAGGPGLCTEHKFGKL